MTNDLQAVALLPSNPGRPRTVHRYIATSSIIGDEFESPEPGARLVSSAPLDTEAAYVIVCVWLLP